MMETYSMSYADVVRTKDRQSNAPSTRRSIEERARRSMEGGSREALGLYDRQQHEKANVHKRMQQAKRTIHEQTRKDTGSSWEVQKIGRALWSGWEHGVNGAIDGTMQLLQWTGKWLWETTAEAVHWTEWGLTDKLVKDTEWIRDGLDTTGQVLGETAGKLAMGEGNEVMDTTTRYWREKVDTIMNMSGEEQARLAWEWLAFVATAAVTAKGLDKTSKISTLSREISLGDSVIARGADKVVSEGGQIGMELVGGNRNDGRKMGDYRAFSKERGAMGERVKPEITNPEKKDIPPDTTAIPKYADKQPYEVNLVLKEQIDKIIDYGENNLTRILENANPADVVEFGRLNSRWNAWVRAKLGNLWNFVEYVEQAEKFWLSEWELISAKNHLKYKIRDEGLKSLVNMIDSLTEEWKFLLIRQNRRKLEKLNVRIENIPDLPVTY